MDSYDWSRFPAAWFGANATHWESPSQIAAIGKYAMAILGWQHLAGLDNMTAVVYAQLTQAAQESADDDAIGRALLRVVGGRRRRRPSGTSTARARRRRLSRQDVEGWNAELVAALRNTTAHASVNHSRVNQYQLAAALREIHFASPSRSTPR